MITEYAWRSVGYGIMAFETYLTSRNAVDFADFLLPHLAPDFHVLDAGCGRGSIAVGLAKQGCHVVGIDLDMEEFAEARQYAAQHGMANVEFQTGSVYALNFPAAHFDACFCHSVL